MDLHRPKVRIGAGAETEAPAQAPAPPAPVKPPPPKPSGGTRGKPPPAKAPVDPLSRTVPEDRAARLRQLATKVSSYQPKIEEERLFRETRRPSEGTGRVGGGPGVPADFLIDQASEARERKLEAERGELAKTRQAVVREGPAVPAKALAPGFDTQAHLGKLDRAIETSEAEATQAARRFDKEAEKRADLQADAYRRARSQLAGAKPLGLEEAKLAFRERAAELGLKTSAEVEASKDPELRRRIAVLERAAATSTQ